MKVTAIRHKPRSPDDWVARLARKQRQMDERRAQASASAIYQRDVQLDRLRSAMAALKERVAQDVESLDREFPDRAIRFEPVPGDGFVVRREHYPEVRLTVMPHLADCSVRVDYVLASASGTAVPKLRELVLTDWNGFRWAFRDEPHRVFRTAAELSEYLLVPLVTGQLV